MDIKEVAVVGHGLMGRGVIHTFASHGFKVVAVKRRVNDHRLDSYFQREIQRGRLTQEEYERINENIKVTTDIQEVESSQIIIENIQEDPMAKIKLFEQLDDICPSDTIFSSNTSSIPIGKLGKDTSRPDKFIGFHFMSPVPIMELVEIVRSMETSDETLDKIIQLSKEINKVPVVVKDFPGFASSRLVSTLVNEAAHIYMQGVAEAEDIDTIAKLGMNLPIGPLRLADEVGLDITLNTLDSLYENYKDSKYRACPLIRVMVETGHLGRKSGKGFYSYSK